MAPALDEHPELVGMGLSLGVELREAGEQRETIALLPDCWDPVTDPQFTLHAYAFFPVSALPSGVVSDAAVLSRWSVRVNGTADRILTLWGARTRWSGTIDIPLEELVLRGHERNPLAIDPHSGRYPCSRPARDKR